MLSRAAVAGLAMTLAAPTFADYTSRCGSIDGRRNTCRLSQPGYVTIERKISGARHALQASRWPGAHAYNRPIGLTPPEAPG
jgi:hypothetical protein